ncbi:MAG: hypothetical protein E3J64_00670 [Anaerolineales bacterium]|nr:MAG: hypothetical protein E3J64_00670 [Anaerolineales bacterium]
MFIRRSGDTIRPLGIVGCLRAGFEIVSRRPWLVLLPVVVDLLLWLGPRLSFDPAWVAASINDYVALATAAGAVDPQSVTQIEQMVTFLVDVSERFNLFSLLNLVPLLNVPSLIGHRSGYYRIAVASPLGARPALFVEGIGPLAGWMALVLPLGVILAFVYLTSVAGPAGRLRQVKSGDRSNPSKLVVVETRPDPEQKLGLQEHLSRLIQFLLFAALVLVAVLIAAPIMGVAVATTWSMSELLGISLAMFGTGLAYYIALQIAFVAPSIVLGGRKLIPAIRESVTIVYVESRPAIWFVFAVFILYQLASGLWTLAEPDSWALAAGIIGNACVGTGLTAATFVFYQERAARLKRRLAPADQPPRSSDDGEEAKE